MIAADRPQERRGTFRRAVVRRPSDVFARAARALLACIALTSGFAIADASDRIRLAVPSAEPSPSGTQGSGTDPSGRTLPAGEPGAEDGRRAFDFQAFESRIQQLWFQRKILLSQGREEDAARQGELIRTFCQEEGIGRLESIADALLVESARHAEQGHYEQSLASLELAEQLDPGRGQIHFARAEVLWKSGGGMFAAAGQILAGVRASVVRGVENMTLVNQAGFFLVLAILGTVTLFGLLMAVRYHAALRHEIEEACLRAGRAEWGRGLGWIVVLSPFLLWVGTGWAALFWVAVFFRYMARAERVAAVGLLALTFVAVPAYRTSVAVYGMTTDPAVRTTLEAASGPYSPERIVKLRKLVAADPEDARYRFLLAGLYKNGRYFDEAFDEYRLALQLDPTLYQANINIGNIFHVSGHFGEAIAHYQKAIDQHPESALAYYDMYLAQSESFRFKEADASLARARTIDPDWVTRAMADAREAGDRPLVLDAQIETGSIWRAALEGRGPDRPTGDVSLAGIATNMLNPLGAATLVAFLACFGLAWMGREPARGCIRCGRAFCGHCKSGREGHEYCTQCQHLFVLGDGLAPETKTRKLYEVRRHERRTRLSRRIAGIVVPGAGHLLRGRGLLGVTLAVAWFAGILAWKPGILRPVETLLGADLRLDLLRAGEVPSSFHVDPTALAGLVLAVIAWVAANFSLVRRREA